MSPFFRIKKIVGGLYCTICRILVPQQGIEPTSLAVEVWNLNQQTTREAPLCVSFTFTLHTHPEDFTFDPLVPTLKQFSVTPAGCLKI